MTYRVLTLAAIGLLSIGTCAQAQPWSEGELASAVDALVQKLPVAR